MTTNLATAFGQIDQVIYDMRADGFFTSLSASARNLDRITTNVARGRGTLGKIVEDNGLYLQLDNLMTKANTLFNDINQYGLLFQYNKEWQRNRVRLMSEANRIKDPKAFQLYMDKEVDQINTTLERMTDLTEQFNIDELAHNKRFKKRFTELLQQINSLQTRVKLYNEELNHIKCQD